MPRYEKGSIVPGSTNDRVLEFLQADRGWLSDWILMDEVQASQATTRQALNRLRRQGLVEYRCRELAFTGVQHFAGGNPYDTVSEWRAK